MNKTVIFELTDEETKRLEADIGVYGGSVLEKLDHELYRTTNTAPIDPNKKTRYRATVSDLLFWNIPDWKAKVVQWL